jgi:hypothetical protein
LRTANFGLRRILAMDDFLATLKPP